MIFTNNLKPNAQRAKAAITLVWIVTALIGCKFLLILAEWFSPVKSFITDDATNYYVFLLLKEIIEALYLLFLIVSSITFIRWFRRAYWNLSQYIGSLSYTDGWAAGSWFIPFAGMYIPYKMMRELFDKTEDLFSLNLRTCSVRLKENPIGLWWFMWVVGFTLDVFSLEIGGLLTFFMKILKLVAPLFIIIAGVTLTKLIRNYSAVEPMLAEMEDEEDDIGGLQSGNLSN